MTHLEILRKAFTDIGIEFYERTDEGYTYIFLGEDKGEDVEYLTITERFFEFEKDGRIASY